MKSVGVVRARSRAADRHRSPAEMPPSLKDCTGVPIFVKLCLRDGFAQAPTLETIGDPMTFTAVYMPVPEGYIGFVEEIPGANSQGETLDEVRENLREAVQLVLEANRELAEQALVGKDVEREPFELAS